ncbi:MAG: bacteriohemerythrin [Gammaproteobacteria bacterium]|nr:bacteriohemerythrin [Gammaproteobacteria bacterium]
MEKINWTNEYSVGVKALDDQHKEIIRLINTLIEGSNDTVDSAITFNVLTEMMTYAQKHLDFEENLLEQHHYFDLMNHAAKHVRYLEKVAKFSFGTMARDENIPKDLLEFLQNWWLHHILEEDMQYKAFFKERGIK